MLLPIEATRPGSDWMPDMRLLAKVDAALVACDPDRRRPADHAPDDALQPRCEAARQRLDEAGHVRHELRPRRRGVRRHRADPRRDRRDDARQPAPEHAREGRHEAADAGYEPGPRRARLLDHRRDPLDRRIHGPRAIPISSRGAAKATRPRPRRTGERLGGGLHGPDEPRYAVDDRRDHTDDERERVDEEDDGRDEDVPDHLG